MKRRDFISMIGMLGLCPVAARAQQPVRARRIGLLTSSDKEDPEAQAWVAAFREELRKLGWSNVEIDVRWTNADVGLARKPAIPAAGALGMRIEEVE
jgi:hypothetical protein